MFTYFVGSFSLVACGGGGGGSASDVSSIASISPNTAPSFVSDGELTVLEGSLEIASIEVRDLESDFSGVVQSIQGGSDSSLFEISPSGDLSFLAGADFENPSDADRNNIYEVTIGVSDGDQSATLAATVTVLDAVEGRVIDAPLSGSTVFIDLDGDSVQDDDEPVSTSDGDGYFVVKRSDALAGVTPRIISVGGTDTQTAKELPNLALISELASDSTKDMAVTPLTTVVASATTPEAKTKLLTALGISSSVEELLTMDTWALAESGDETAKNLQKKINRSV